MVRAYALEPVTFIGYPSGLYDRHNLTPVARRGSTATPIAIDYEGEPAFLIDASVFEGSSGSPVFIHQPGGYAARTGGFVIGERLICVGVLAAGPARARIGGIVSVPTSVRQVAVLDELLALGKVYKAWTVDEIVQAFLDRARLTRVPEAPEAPAEAEAGKSAADEQLAEAIDE